MNNVFINETIEEAFKIYNEYEKHPESIEYNSFLCSIIRMLVIIYGDDVIINYNNRNTSGFMEMLCRYGISNEMANDFIILVDKYNKFEMKQVEKTFKKKNKFFNAIQKCLIDMFVKKYQTEVITDDIIEKFYNQLFTANSKDFYRQSIALVTALNPYEIDEYYKKQKLGD